MNYHVNAKPLRENSSFVKNVFFVICLFLAATIQAQDTADTNKGVFQFEAEEIDYGTIQQDANGERTFKFKNVGNAPIVITNVKASCGCTVPTKPEKPVMPGETAEIGVKYATKRIGAFSKTITVTSNASEGTKLLKIKGKVLGADGTASAAKKAKKKKKASKTE